MDLNYSYSILTFLIGLLSGFQAIIEKYGRSPVKAALTIAGLAYLILRGFLASITFVALYASGIIQQRLLVWALVTGTGAEIFLRTKFFIREKQSEGGGAEEVMLGPLNLILFFQNFFLSRVEEQLYPEISRAKRKIDYLKTHLPKDTGFEDLRQLVMPRLRAFESNSNLVTRLKAEIEKLQGEYEARLMDGAEDSIEEEFKHKLGYVLLHIVGEEGFSTLVK